MKRSRVQDKVLILKMTYRRFEYWLFLQEPLRTRCAEEVKSTKVFCIFSKSHDGRPFKVKVDTVNLKSLLPKAGKLSTLMQDYKISYDQSIAWEESQEVQGLMAFCRLGKIFAFVTQFVFFLISTFFFFITCQSKRS